MPKRKLGDVKQPAAKREASNYYLEAIKALPSIRKAIGFFLKKEKQRLEERREELKGMASSQVENHKSGDREDVFENILAGDAKFKELSHEYRATVTLKEDFKKFYCTLRKAFFPELFSCDKVETLLSDEHSGFRYFLNELVEKKAIEEEDPNFEGFDSDDAPEQERVVRFSLFAVRQAWSSTSTGNTQLHDTPAASDRGM